MPAVFGHTRSLIRSVTPGDLEGISRVCERMRKSDRKEILAMRSNGLGDFARDLSIFSKESWLVRLDGKPVSALGVCELGHGVLSCWMVATHEWKKVARTTTNFIRHSFIPSLVEKGYWRGEVFALAENSKSLRWLYFLGFRKSSLCKGIGAGGEDFYFYVCDFKGD